MVFYYESNDHVVYAGRDKYENEILLKNCFDDVDVWFHCDQISSAHVYLRLKSGESIETIDESILMDCCQLVKHCSIEGNKMRKVDVVYTLASNLRKTRAMDVGQVSFRDEKLVHRFKKIRDGRDNEIVNRLNKTKREVTNPDLEGEKMRYLEDKKREKREFQRVIDEETRVRVETMKEDLAKRDYKLLDVEEKKTTNKQMMEKYDSYEEAEDDFM